MTQYYKSVMINKGILDGLKKNMTVLDRNGCLVGRILGSLTLKEAKVQLITDNESGISVITEDNKVLGILSGDLKGQCTLKYVLSTEEELETGHRLLTTGFDGIYPPRILVGEVVSIKPTKGLFKKINVRPYFNFHQIDHLAVVLMKAQDFYQGSIR